MVQIINVLKIQTQWRSLYTEKRSYRRWFHQSVKESQIGLHQIWKEDYSSPSTQTKRGFRNVKLSTLHNAHLIIPIPGINSQQFVSCLSVKLWGWQTQEEFMNFAPPTFENMIFLDSRVYWLKLFKHYLTRCSYLQLYIQTDCQSLQVGLLSIKIQ